MMRTLETVWRAVPWAHAVHYCQGSVLIVLSAYIVQIGVPHRGREPEIVKALVRAALADPDIEIKVIVV